MKILTYFDLLTKILAIFDVSKDKFWAYKTET